MCLGVVPPVTVPRPWAGLSSMQGLSQWLSLQYRVGAGTPSLGFTLVNSGGQAMYTAWSKRTLDSLSEKCANAQCFYTASFASVTSRQLHSVGRDAF